MRSELTKDSKILVIGGGTWGCSTALHLARRGYKQMTVLDAYPIPSPISAGNDINKIAEQGSLSEGDSDEAVFQVAIYAANQGWHNGPVFKPYLHETGYILAGTSQEAIERLRERDIRDHESEYTNLATAEEFRATMPEGVLTGEFPGWEGYYKSTGAGWVHARKALVAACTEAKRLGVNFITGSPEGQVTSLVFSEEDVLGAKTVDGKEHLADRTILAAGASAPQFLDFKNQLRPTAWTLAHIPTTEEEGRLYKDLPVLFNIEKGFFMEPDEDHRHIKICDEHPGYCN